MSPIPFLDLKAAYRELKREIDHAISGVLDSGRYVQGHAVESFEASFANYCGATHAVGVANGLDAIHLTLRAMGIGPGDEVIVPSNTFIATWLAVSHCGATPVPVEPIEGTHNLDPDRIERAITSRTRGIIAVHLYGQPADIDAIKMIAERHGLKLIEDAAQAHGARYRGQAIGAHGHAVTWSFYPGKNLGAFGDGGAVTTSDAALANRIRLLGNYGSRTKYINDVQGFNSRLDPIQAACLNVKLGHLDEWNARRRIVASIYLDILSECEVQLPHVPNWAEPAWHLFVVRVRERGVIQAELAARGIETLIHYPTPPHLQAAYRDAGMTAGSLPIAEQLAGEVLSLPIGPHMTSDDAQHVATNLLDCIRRSR